MLLIINGLQIIQNNIGEYLYEKYKWENHNYGLLIIISISDAKMAINKLLCSLVIKIEIFKT